MAHTPLGVGAAYGGGAPGVPGGAALGGAALRGAALGGGPAYESGAPSMEML
jgi:hypothetical protein